VSAELGTELSAVDVRDGDKMEQAIMAFAREPNGGLIVTASISATQHRDLIIALAARLHLPAVYPRTREVGPRHSVCWVAHESGGLKSLQRSDEGRCIQRQG
jgi:hypothetical protein